MRPSVSHKYLFLAALIFIGAAFGISLTVGRYPLHWDKIFSDPMENRVFFVLRLPRTLMALTTGVALGVAGSLFQRVFQNPLASPDMIGVASGSSVGAAVAILFFGGVGITVVACSFVGGLLAVVCCLVLASISGKSNLSSVVLSGIAVNALTQALLMFLKLTADPEKQLAAIEFWTMGSFADVTADKFAASVPFVVIALVIICLLHRPILMLHLHQEDAQMLGVPVAVLRWGVLFLATLLTGAVVSMVGLISFIGLLAPHIAGLLLKTSRFRQIVFSGLVGGTLLLTADILARSVAQGELPVSIITSFVGAPFLFLVLCRKGGFHD